MNPFGGPNLGRALENYRQNPNVPQRPQPPVGGGIMGGQGGFQPPMGGPANRPMPMGGGIMGGQPRPQRPMNTGLGPMRRPF